MYFIQKPHVLQYSSFTFSLHQFGVPIADHVQDTHFEYTGTLNQEDSWDGICSTVELPLLIFLTLIAVQL
jgi:hypothetical protein